MRSTDLNRHGAKAAHRSSLRLFIGGLLAAGSLSLNPPATQAGIDVWTSSGPYGGTVLALAIDPSASSTVYAGTGTLSLPKTHVRTV